MENIIIICLVLLLIYIFYKVRNDKVQEFFDQPIKNNYYNIPFSGEIESESIPITLKETDDGGYVRLYEDFEPTSTGSDVKMLVLNHADNLTPVVLVINEIDVVYNAASSETSRRDQYGRTCHAFDKTSLNNFFDSVINL